MSGQARVAVATALLALLAVGCSVPKKGGLGDVSRMMTERGLPQLRWNQGTQEDEEAQRLVQKLLAGELTARGAVEVALLGNPRLQATYERLGVAQADLVQAGLLRNPSFGVHIGLPMGQPAWDGVAWEFSLAQEFLDLFMLPLRKRLQQAEFDRVKLEVGHAVLELVAEVRAAYYAAQASRQVADMRKIILEAAQASAELAARQQEAGNLSDLDLASEQGLYAQARVDLTRAEQQANADREHLTRLLGLWGRLTAYRLPHTLPALPDKDPALDKVESYAVGHRLDLQAAKKEMELVRRELVAVKATRWLGTLEFGGDAHREPEGFQVIGPSLRLEVPIFDQGQARVARLVARYRQAHRNLQALAVSARSEVREIANRMFTARATAEYYRTTVLPLRERIVALSQQQYNAMLLGVYQLLSAKQNEVNAYREYIESVRDYWVARAELERAAGGPLP